MRLLDLFCGAGGAAMGYHRAGFTEIVGVDIKPQPRYPFSFVQADALEYVRAHGREFNLIHASPPCQGYSPMKSMWNARRHELLIEPTRDALRSTGKPWVIENVMGSGLDGAVLCGLMFGLPVHRHRRFQASFYFLCPPEPPDAADMFSVAKAGGAQRTVAKASRRIREIARDVFGVPWMTAQWQAEDGLSQAIPPAYTEFIGRQLIGALR